MFCHKCICNHCSYGMNCSYCDTWLNRHIIIAEGLMSISNNSDNELVCTIKTGPNTYKKNYIYLNAYTMYVVEDITGTMTDPYHYKMYFHTEVLPDVEVKP